MHWQKIEQYIAKYDHFSGQYTLNVYKGGAGFEWKIMCENNDDFVLLTKQAHQTVSEATDSAEKALARYLAMYKILGNSMGLDDIINQKSA